MPNPKDEPRSRVLGMFVVAVLAAGLLAACGNDESGSESGSEAPADASAADLPNLEGTTITFLGFGGSQQEQYQEHWFEPFEQATGATVISDEPTDYTKIETQVESGNVQYDLVDGDPYVMDPGCGEQWEELDVDDSDIAEEFATSSPCSVADIQYFYTIAYDTEAFPDGGPQTCQDFFDTEKFPGKRAVWSYYVSAIGECAWVAAGGDPADPYPIDIDAAYEQLDRIKDELVIYDSGATATDMMQNQDVAMGIFTTQRVSEAVSAGAPFETSDEWFMRFFGSFGIPMGAPNAEGARALLGYIVQKEVNPRWLEGFIGGSGNVTNPIEIYDPEEVVPVDATHDAVVDWDWWQENEAEFGDRWSAYATG